jgi:hypothetical protein
MNLRTVIHLFRADVRRLRWLIIATLALLLFELSPWLTNGPWRLPAWSSSHDSDVPAGYAARSGFRLQVMPLTGWLLAAAAGWCGLAEARVRPVRQREIFATKLLFLTTLLWLPQSAALLLVLRVNGLSWDDALLSLAACAGVFVPLWTAALLTGRLAGSFWRWLAVVGCVIALSAFAAMFSTRFTSGMGEILIDAWGANCGPHTWYYLATVATCLLLLLRLARSWKLPSRIAAVTAIFLGGAGVWHTHDWFIITGPLMDGTSLPPDALAAVQPEPTAEGLSAELRMDDAQAWLTPRVSFATQHPPPGAFCYWQRTGEATLSRGGKVIASASASASATGHSDSARVSLEWLFPPAGTPMDEASLIAALPAGARQRMNAPAWSPFERTPAQLGSLRVADGVDLSGSEPVTLEAGLTGILYRHVLVVDADLATATTVNYDGMRLHLRQVTIPKRRLPCVDISVISPAQGVGPDPLQLNWRMGPFTAWRMFLFLPASGTLIGGAGNPVLQRAGPVLGGASMHRRIIEFEDGIRPRQFSPEELAGARVLVLAPRLLALVQRKVQTPPMPLRLEANDSGGSDFYNTFGPSVQPRHYFDYVRPRRPDPATATNDQFGQWLRYVLAAQVQDDWQAAELAEWMPRHMETLLNIRRYSTSYDSAWNQAIARALPESRKQEIIRRVPQDASLVYVLLARGWVEDARAELIELLNSGAYLDSVALAAVSSLRDPATVPALLARLEQSADASLYDALRLMDGIEPRLTETLHRYFARVTVHGRAPAGLPGHESEFHFTRIETPLAHGLPEALADVLVLHRWLCSDREPGARAYLRERMAHQIKLPHGMEPRSEAARQFFFKLQPDQCRWDALTRRWLTPEL